MILDKPIGLNIQIDNFRLPSEYRQNSSGKNHQWKSGNNARHPMMSILGSGWVAMLVAIPNDFCDICPFRQISHGFADIGDSIIPSANPKYNFRMLSYLAWPRRRCSNKLFEKSTFFITKHLITVSRVCTCCCSLFVRSYLHADICHFIRWHYTQSMHFEYQFKSEQYERYTHFFRHVLVPVTTCMMHMGEKTKKNNQSALQCSTHSWFWIHVNVGLLRLIDVVAKIRDTLVPQ